MVAVTTSIFLASLISIANAYGDRGAVERVLYYYAYLAEEYDPSKSASTYTIAPGCGQAMGGVRAGNRCNFNQLLEYIWSPHYSSKPEAERPSNVRDDPTDDRIKPDLSQRGSELLKPSEIAEDIDWKSLWQRTGKWRDKDTGKAITWNIDPQKLVGAENYYSALSRIGVPIGEAEQRRLAVAGTDARQALSKRETRLFAFAKEAANTLVELRSADFENSRIEFVKRSLPGIQLETVEGPRTAPGNQRKYKLINAAATVRSNEGKDANVRDNLQRAIKSAEEAESAKLHLAALRAAQATRAKLKCGAAAAA